MLNKAEATIDWTESAQHISCQIRGLDPWPKATTSLADKWLRPYKPQVLTDKSDERPGTILTVSKQGITIATGQGCLLFSEIQLEGKKRMAVQSFIQGYSLETGLVLGAS